MDKKYIVTKSNKLITANYDLSLQEQKIILTLASMVQPHDTEFKEYEFRIKDFIKLLGIKDDKKYSEVPKITKDLMKKVFEIREGKDIVQLSWLSSTRYKTGEGTVILKFDSNLKPYMLELKELYTSFKLENVLSLKSKYSIRFYEILKSNLFKKCIEIECEELKKMAGAKEKAYNIYANFKNKVLLQAQKELCKKTDICFEFEEIKTGRKVTALKFYIKPNQVQKEISATQTDPEPKAQKEISEDEAFGVRRVKELITEHDITDLEALKILKSANADFAVIQRVYNHFKNKQLDSLVGTMISMVKPGAFQEPKSNVPKTKFNDYDQRSYDYDVLEKKLLGWDKEETDIVGEKFKQSKLEVL